MALSRHLLFPAFGLGAYDYGIMRYRYPMELSNYLAVFAVAVVLYYVIRRLALSQEQQLAAAELEAKLAEAQLDNLRLQLQPHFLFNTLNTISSVMYEDVPAADAMLTPAQRAVAPHRCAPRARRRSRWPRSSRSRGCTSTSCTSASRRSCA